MQSPPAQGWWIETAAIIGGLHGARALTPAWVDKLIGRRGADDDGQDFRLLARVGESFATAFPPRRATDQMDDSDDPTSWPLVGSAGNRARFLLV